MTNVSTESGTNIYPAKKINHFEAFQILYGIGEPPPYNNQISTKRLFFSPRNLKIRAA